MKTFLTKEGKLKLQNDLDFLVNTEKKRILVELSDAREAGNLEENSQYIIAKEEYDKIALKIDKIRHILENSIVVDNSDVDVSKVSLLTTVKVINIDNDKELTFSIVPENEIDSRTKISPLSPVGSGLIGKSVGDVCQIRTPVGFFRCKIINISKY